MVFCQGSGCVRAHSGCQGELCYLPSLSLPSPWDCLEHDSGGLETWLFSKKEDSQLKGKCVSRCKRGRWITRGFLCLFLIFCLLFFLLQIPCLNFCVILELEGRELTVRAQRTAYACSNLNSNNIFYFLKVIKIQCNYRCKSVKKIAGL